MTTLLYDESFEGLMTAVFLIFEQRFEHAEIIKNASYNNTFFADVIHVSTDQEKADRVLKRLHTQTGHEGVRMLIYSFLSEDIYLEKNILEAIRYAITNTDKNVFTDFAHPSVLQLAKYTKSVGREKHRMEAFIRFEQYKNEVYVAKISPDFNVLPLILKHFSSRYQDQQWIIYDIRRNYGYYYDLQKTEEIFLEDNTTLLQVNTDDLHEKEMLYQKLWQRYFVKTNITERKNSKLHVRHVPKRYWKYLTEKKT